MEIIFVLVVIALGAAAVLFAVCSVVIRMLGSAGRGLQSMLHAGPGPEKDGAAGFRRVRGGAVCQNPQCGRIEYRRAAYCSQCGRPMNGSR